jgi:hypothetical protein
MEKDLPSKAPFLLQSAYDSMRGIVEHWANEPPVEGWDYAAFLAAAGPGSQNDPE